MNDLEVDISARNIIMLLIALTIDDVEKAADYILHIWYSAQFKQTYLELLNLSVSPLVREIYFKIREKPISTVLAKT